MSTITAQPLLVAILDGNEVKDVQSKDLGDVKDVVTEVSIDRDCLCGNFSAGDAQFAKRGNAIKSRW